MTIKSITIKNIRGLGNQRIELNMIPNKPSLLVAPNGSGKSSFAVAFQSLKRDALGVPKEEIYNNVDTNVPELIVETDENEFRANPEINTISKQFGVFVINDLNKPKPSLRKIQKVPIPMVKMCVDPIVLINHIPQDVRLECTLLNDFSLLNLKKGTIPSISDLLNDVTFLSNFSDADLKNIKRQTSVVEAFLKKLKDYTGTKNQIWERIEREYVAELKSLPILNSRIDDIRRCCPNDTEIVLYLKLIQIIYTYKKNPALFNKKIDYCRSKKEQQGYKVLFDSLKDTWKGVHPQIQGDKLIVEIPDTTKLSNGERDIIVFLAMIQKAKQILTKDENILIIDEVFDYLDDANLIAAQYYITNFINELKKEGRFIYPIIMSHLNPDFFKSYAFSDLKVYYLKPISFPRSSEKMKRLLYKRTELEKQNDDSISKYLVHFYCDYDIDLIAKLGEDFCPWNKPRCFKAYCFKETHSYLYEPGKPFDALAVCVALRECIEKYIYDKLPTEVKNKLFDCSQNGTNNKIKFAQDNGVCCPETFYLLGLIYNNPLHMYPGQTKDLRQTLYSRLMNNTIRSMIEKIISPYMDEYFSEVI